MKVFRAAAGLLLLVLSGPAGAANLPEGFSETPVARGFTGATAMDIAPDGRIFICEQTGTLRIVKHDVLLAEPFVKLAVDSSWERGLLGVAFDPRFPKNHYVYLNYISPKPYPHHRISRFIARGDRAVPDSEVILFKGDNQTKLGGGVQNGHQGGAIHFGKDGKLYIAIGDQTAGEPAQSMKTLQGKMLRINPDGSIPRDNPFYRVTTGKYRAIWALGLRNPFTFAVQPGTGRIFINDVGGANEEINEGVAGANYGWPTADHGPTSDRRFRGPIYWYPESSITGGTFYNPAARQFPAAYAGKYFFNDFKAGWIKVLDPDHPRDVRDFATGFATWMVVDLKVSADGSLYYLSRNAWVIDNDFRPGTGGLYKICYTGNKTPPHIACNPLPQTVPAGGTAYFRVTATGSRTLRFQWQRNGVNVADGSSATYTIPSAMRADDGARFRCVVSNAFGKATSTPTDLAVTASDRETDARALGGFFIRPYPGTYTGLVQVRLSYEDGRASVRYTTDGSTPTARSAAYTAPLRLSRTTTIKVQAFKDGKPQGKPATAVFTIAGAAPYGLPGRDSVSTVKMPPIPERAPRLLSQTGVFASLADLRPNPGLIPYDVNTPLWSDGALKRRWVALPPGSRIGFAADGEWTFPGGTVFVKHFELAADDTNPKVKRRLETRLLVVDGTGNGYGLIYKWRPDQRDAELLADSLSENISIKTAAGRRTQTWYYPSRTDCLTCHTTAAKFVLGVKTRQLNRAFTYPDSGVSDNQLRTWNYLGMFSPRIEEGRVAKYRRLVPIDDAKASLEERSRSYLDANCAHCHRPGNTLRAAFDARYDTRLADQHLLDAATVSDSFNVVNPRVIAPHDVGRSMLYQRMTRFDNFRMPPLASNVRDRAALSVLEQWINSLRPVGKAKRLSQRRKGQEKSGRLEPRGPARPVASEKADAFIGPAASRAGALPARRSGRGKCFSSSIRSRALAS
jgi:uncharacterized repeat protein (TIGR03806 family)